MSIATINGCAIPAISPVSWSLVPGTRPYIGTVQMDRDAAIDVVRNSGGLARLVLGDGAASVAIDQLHILRLEPGGRPEFANIVLADRRILWERVYLSREYNVRKRTGVKRALAVAKDLPELSPIADDVYYRQASLNAGARWTARAALADIVAACGTGTATIPEGAGEWFLDDQSYEGTGDQVIAMILADIGGLDVTIDPDGAVRVLARNGGGEKRVLAAGGDRVYGRGATGEADRRFYRPSAVRVLFERDVECRLDFVSATSTQAPATANRSRANDQEPRIPTRLENVLPLPDPYLTIGGTEYRAGQWVRIDDYLAAIAGTEPTGAPTITDAFLRKTFSYQGYLEQLYGSTGDPVWERRYATIWRHWRQTFRIVGDDAYLFRNWRPVLATVADNETGTRQPSPVFAAYTRKPSIFGIWRLRTDKREMAWAIGSWAESLSAAKLAPAKVRVIDQDLGILRISAAEDLFGLNEESIPGELESPPLQVPAKGDGVAALVSWYVVTLATPWNLATIVSGMLAAPATEQRMYAVEVAAGDLGVKNALGPPMAMAVSGGLAVARFRYEDSTTEPRYSRASELANEEELLALARAEAHRIYHRMADREQGNYATALAPSAVIDGSLSIVTHTIGLAGDALTSYALLPELEAPSIWAYVPQKIQDITRRLAQP